MFLAVMLRRKFSKDELFDRTGFKPFIDNAAWMCGRRSETIRPYSPKLAFTLVVFCL
jgi:hypothetical protein